MDEEILFNISELCKECGFYKDCPMKYRCPPMEILFQLAEEIKDE